MIIVSLTDEQVVWKKHDISSFNYYIRCECIRILGFWKQKTNGGFIYLHSFPYFGLILKLLASFTHIWKRKKWLYFSCFRNGRNEILVSCVLLSFFTLLHGDYSVPLPYVSKHAQTKGKCSFKDIGYKPSGRITEVKKLDAPVAKLQKTLIDKIAGKSSMSASLLMHSVNAGKAFTTVTETSMKAVKFLVNLAPKLASTLGIFGAVFSFVSDATKPSAQQIIDSTNVAFENLTSEMNDRIDQLQGYVDSRVIQLEKAMVTRELKVMQNIWLNCADELIDTATINECQRDAARFIRANKPKFLLFGDKKTAHKQLDSYTIRRAEASLFAFREFANLCIMVGETVAGSYELKTKDDITSRKYFIRYIQRLIDDIVEFKAHATWILSEIIRVHTRGSCETTIRCGKKTAIREGLSGFKVHTADRAWCRCLFDPTLVSLNYYISVSVILFHQKL